MTTPFSAPPPDNAALRRGLYLGNLYKLRSTDASHALADAVGVMLRTELGADDVRRVPRRLAPEDLFQRIGRIRKALYLEERFHSLVREVLSASGFDPAHVAFDPLRLRVIAHNGHENPRALPVYYPHRDTWYGHPQSIITWWIPLDDLVEEETFLFYPDWYSSPVPNDSEIFDYDEWVSKGWSLKIGWQDLEAGRTARYPQVLGPFEPAAAVGFACARAENVLFSGAHFHRTRPQTAGLCRYSLDFRIVHIADHRAGLGAPNVDNRSRGSALADYTMPRAIDAAAEREHAGSR
jgi:hypothetical protein